MNNLTYEERVIVISKIIQKRIERDRRKYEFLVYLSNHNPIYEDKDKMRDLHNQTIKNYNIVKNFYENTKDKIYDLKIANTFGKGFDLIDEIITMINTSGSVLNLGQIDMILSFIESFLLLYV